MSTPWEGYGEEEQEEDGVSYSMHFGFCGGRDKLDGFVWKEEGISFLTLELRSP